MGGKIQNVVQKKGAGFFLNGQFRMPNFFQKSLKTFFRVKLILEKFAKKNRSFSTFSRKSFFCLKNKVKNNLGKENVFEKKSGVR